MTTETIVDNDRYSWSYSSYQDNCTGTARPTTSRFSANFAGGRTKSSKYPDWRRRIAVGSNCTNNYSRYGYVFIHSPGFVSWNSTKQCGLSKRNLSGWVQGTANNSPPSSLSLPANSGEALAIATAKFAQAVLEAQTHISGPTFLGELRSAIGMIRKPAKGLSKAIYDYLDDLKGYSRRCRRKSKQLIDSDIYGIYLEHVFGWLPLIGDTQKGAEALSRLINGDRPNRQVRGFHSLKTANIHSPSTVTVAGGLLRSRAEFRDVTEVSVSIRGAVRAKAVGPLWRSMDLFGFDADYFVPTMWELLPMSWVTDYFSNVGDILSATYTDFSGLYWDSCTQKLRASRQYLESPFVVNTAVAGPNFSGGGSGGSWTLERKSMVRTRLESRVPDLVFSLPGKPSQLINLSAVLAQSKGIGVTLSGLLNK